MKVDPLNLILDNQYLLDKTFYFISGNEVTLMNKVKDIIADKLCKISNISIEKIKNISLVNDDVGLFGDYKLYVINDTQGLNNETIENLSRSNDKFIFFIENSPKIKSIKSVFLKRSDCDLFECYELSRETKSKIVKNFIDTKGIEINDSLYWGLVDMLDNRYQLLENELNKILEFPNKEVTEKLIKSTVTRNSDGIEKIFFNILKSNKQIIDNYNRKITNSDDVNKMYFYIKQLCLLILNFNNTNDFEKNIPAYLFREKNFLINLFNKFNQNKRGALLDLLYDTELNIRSNGELSSTIGLRFLLKFKKISIS